MTIAIQTHLLVPTHSKLSHEEKEILLEEKKVTLRQLPRILKTDPAIASLGIKEGDIVKINRASPTSGQTVYYRVVI